MKSFPPAKVSAQPVSQDRSERIVSTAILNQPLSEVWNGLISYEIVAQWFGVVDKQWATVDHESILDFEDGEFFLCHTDLCEAPSDGNAKLEYRWRWNGVGPAATVTWVLSEVEDATSVSVTEVLENGPSDWRSWNGMGWPGIIDQLGDHLSTGRNTRWTWRRMGPFVQFPMPAPSFLVWPRLVAEESLPFWMGRTQGSFTAEDTMKFMIGDASGTSELTVTEVVEPNQKFPSFQPSLSFLLRREGSPGPLAGYLWLEPGGLHTSIAQVFMSGWECYGPLENAPIDRHLLTSFWIGAFQRLSSLVVPPGMPSQRDDGMPGPHGWSR